MQILFLQASELATTIVNLATNLMVHTCLKNSSCDFEHLLTFCKIKTPISSIMVYHKYVLANYKNIVYKEKAPGTCIKQIGLQN